MATTIEIVRFEVRPERQAELVARHLGARRAIRSVSPPGALWSRLGRHGERGWIEVVAWGARAVFERALELSPHEPGARSWFELAEPGWTLAIGEAPDAAGDPPPREGSLELQPLRARESANGAAAAGEPWTTRVVVDGRTWVDPEGWTAREPAVLRLVVRAGGDAPAPGADSPRELARIADAVDAAEEEDGPGA
jgi:hypothetical protein